MIFRIRTKPLWTSHKPSICKKIEILWNNGEIFLDNYWHFIIPQSLLFNYKSNIYDIPRNKFYFLFSQNLQIIITTQEKSTSKMENIYKKSKKYNYLDKLLEIVSNELLISINSETFPSNWNWKVVYDEIVCSCTNTKYSFFYVFFHILFSNFTLQFSLVFSEMLQLSWYVYHVLPPHQWKQQYTIY